MNPFTKFLEDIRGIVESLPSYVTDIDIGFDVRSSPWTLSDARQYQTRDEHDPRLAPGDLQIKMVRGTPQIRAMIGRVCVYIVPRRL